MLYAIAWITGIIFYLGCVYLYFLLDRMVEKLGQIDDRLTDMRIDLATTAAEVQRAKKLVERMDDFEPYPSTIKS
tara:strand:- start:138 stop:362 length:225 start_codon:yes stop_codon:yes gene_type:complete